MGARPSGNRLRSGERVSDAPERLKARRMSAAAGGMRPCDGRDEPLRCPAWRGDVRSGEDASEASARSRAGEAEGRALRLLFPKQDGTPWRSHDWKNWTRRVWHVGREGARR